jgi:small-conductance mechanosensitive channel
MRPLAFAAMTLLLAAMVGCSKKQQTSSAGGASDTTVTAAAPAPEPPAPATPREFTFDQRQQFTQTIRQQLATTDQQIQELADQAKSKGGAVSDRALANIRATRKIVDRNLKRVDAATEANWDQVKSTVTQSVDRLSEAIEGAQPK